MQKYRILTGIKKEKMNIRLFIKLLVISHWVVGRLVIRANWLLVIESISH